MKAFDPFRLLAILVTGWLQCSAPVARGEDASVSNVLTLARSLALGLGQSATILNAQRDQQIAATRVTQARSGALPQLSLDASYTRLDEVESLDTGEEIVEAGSLDNYLVELRLNQLLYSSGKVRAAVEAAHMSEAYADWALQSVEASLARMIRVAFFRLLLARERIQVQRESVALFESVLADTEAQFAAGTLPELDVLNARVRVANERPLLLAATADYRIGLLDFQRLLSLDEPIDGLQGELETFAWDARLADLLAEALHNRPDLRALETTIDLLELDVTVTRADGLPSVGLFAAYNGANAYRFVAYEDDWQWHWNVGVAAQWRAFDGGLTRASVLEKRLNVLKSETTLADFRRQVRLEVERAWQNRQLALQTLVATRDSVAQAEMAVRIANTGYGAGVGTFLDVSEANQALRRARLENLTALTDQATAAAELWYAVGRVPVPEADGGAGE